MEAVFLKYPQLEPSFLSGSFPQKALRNKFLMAQPSQANCLLKPPCMLALDKEGKVQLSEGALASESLGAPTSKDMSSSEDAFGLQIISLPGHYFSMVGVMTPDKVFFVADSLAGVPILEKYGIFFLYDIEAELATLSMLESSEAEWFVPAHAEPTRDIKSLVDINRAKIFEIADVILAAVNVKEHDGEGVSLEDVMAAVFSHYDIALNANQYVLVGSTIRSYLSWLCDQGRLEYVFEHQRMIFRIKR